MATVKDAKATAVKGTIPPVEKDEHGFKVGSKAGKLYNLLLTGKYTKAELEKEVDAVGKSTVGVFLGDLQKPVGTYTVSRGAKVVEDAKTHKLSLEGAAPAKAKKATKKAAKAAPAPAAA